MRTGLILALALAPLSSAQFVPSREYPTLHDPFDLAVADLDGDGLQDVAVAAFGDKQMVLHRGDGALGLAPGESLGDAGDILAIEAGDVDGDGWPDLVGTSFQGGKLVYARALGNGAFKTLQKINGAAKGRGVALGDLDDDGDLDAVTSNADKFAAAIYLSDGGTFGTPQHVGPISVWEDVVLADFNGDGELDVAEGEAAGSVMVLPGDGRGGVGAPINVQDVGASVVDLVVCDVDQDGHVDLLGEGVTLRGLGDGTFDAPEYWPVAGGFGVDAADVDGDGALDAVTLYLDQVHVLLGDGHGGFSLHASIFAGQAPLAVRLRDANGDGWPDLLTVNATGPTVSMLAGNGLGDFPAPELATTAGIGPLSVTEGDLDGDGRPEIVVGFESTESVEVLSANAAGQFTSALVLPAGPTTMDVDALDFDLDGDMDLVATEYVASALLFYRATAPLVFSPAQWVSPGAVGPTDLAIADFGAGGPDPDLLATCFASSKLSLLADDGAGGFKAPKVQAMAGMMSQPAIADVDLDGDVDLVGTLSGPSSVQVLLNSGAGVFAPVVIPAPPGSGGLYLDVGDLDEDGLPDLVIPDNQIATLTLRFGTGGGAFGAPVTMPFTDYPLTARIIDVDDDGHRDVLIGTYQAGTISLLRGDGQGNVGTQEIYGLGSDASRFVVADFDGDAQLDVAAPLLPLGLGVLRQTPASPWLNLGHALATASGTPKLQPAGELVAGLPLSIQLQGALPASSATLVIGLSELGAPFKGGTLVPQPTVLLAGLPTGPTGTLELAAPMPPGVPSGTELFLQWWVVDAGAPKGLAASNGVRGTVP